MKIRLLLPLLLFPLSASAENTATCLERVDTQMEMNRCAGLDFKAADKELNRVYNKIRKVYSDDKKFIEKLRISQRAWIKLRDADLEMMYPEENKRVEYGSAYPMCAQGLNTSLTLLRIEYLKKWLVGVEEGEVCSGSIKRPNAISETWK